MHAIVDTVRRTFEREFWPVLGKFDVLMLNQRDGWGREDPRVNRPGVYVWVDGEAVVKVGRHFVNAHKRACEHVQDDTAGKMAHLRDSGTASLILFTLDEEDRHWAAALEVYLETKLREQLTVPASRLG